eukprot:3690950-Amphidinium_carterae.1
MQSRHGVTDEDTGSAVIVAAEFLFDGHMESALSGEMQTMEEAEVDFGDDVFVDGQLSSLEPG